MKKRILTILAALFALVAIDFILESPLLFNLEILFPKNFHTKFRYASAKHSSLSQDDISSIYLAILGDEDKTVVSSRLRNYVSQGYYLNEPTSLELDSTVQAVICANWKVHNRDSRFVVDIDSSYSYRIFKGRENLKLVWISPIKQIDGSFFVAYEYYCGILCGSAIVFRAEKSNGQWFVEPVMRPWIS